MARTLRYYDQASAASGLDILAGLWLLISPFFLPHYVLIARGNDVVLGVIIGVLAAIRLSSPLQTVALSWVNVILGIWVMISPWALRYAWAPVPTWNNVIVGIVVIVLAGWSALATDQSDRVERFD